MCLYFLCWYMGFSNPTPIPVLHPKNTGMVSNCFDTGIVSRKNHRTSIGSHTGMAMPVHIWRFCVCGYWQYIALKTRSPDANFVTILFHFLLVCVWDRCKERMDTLFAVSSLGTIAPHSLTSACHSLKKGHPK